MGWTGRGPSPSSAGPSAPPGVVPLYDQAMAEPRVRPRVPMEDRVNSTVHPLPKKLRTSADGERKPLHWTTKASLTLLALFLVSGPLGAFLVPIVGVWRGLAFILLSVTALVASILMGAE